MKRCKAHLLCVCLLFLLAALPADCQQNTFGIAVGETSDKFGALPSASGPEFDIDGQITVFHANPKSGRPAIVGGGEIQLPTDIGNHAKEYSLYGGLRFPAGNLLIGFNVGIRKIILPTSTVDNQVFVRDKMQLLEIPLVIRYNFGASKRAFIEAQGAPEFSPRFRSGGSLVALPNPNLDHAYFVRGTLGYNFPKWYVKATYENRYFKFLENAGNPNNLYNWRTNRIMGGIGVTF